MTNYTVNCSKCEGLGKVKEFMHIDDGKCFNCEGVGKIIVSKETYEKYVSNKADYIFFNPLNNKIQKVLHSNMGVAKGKYLTDKGKVINGVMVSIAKVIDSPIDYIAFPIGNCAEEVFTEVLKGMYNKSLKATIEDVDGIFNSLPKGMKETVIKDIENKITKAKDTAKQLLSTIN